MSKELWTALFRTKALPKPIIKLAFSFPDQLLRLPLHLRGRHAPVLRLRAGAVLQGARQAPEVEQHERAKHDVLADQEVDQRRYPAPATSAEIPPAPADPGWWKNITLEIKTGTRMARERITSRI